MGKFYILDAEHHTVEVSLLEWAEWFEEIANRIVNWTQITSEVTVSTVFVGLDHRFHGNGPPILFETMIFGGPLNQETYRYASWDDAVTGHQAVVRKARVAAGQRVDAAD